MDESSFDARANATLEALMDRIDEVAGDVLDAELADGVLTVTLESGAQYVINRHSVNREVWLSSPRSGAGHYAWDAAREAWIDRRRGGELRALLEQELAAEAGRPLGLVAAP